MCRIFWIYVKKLFLQFLQNPIYLNGNYSRNVKIKDLFEQAFTVTFIFSYISKKLQFISQNPS